MNTWPSRTPKYANTDYKIKKNLTNNSFPETPYRPLEYYGKVMLSKILKLNLAARYSNTHFKTVGV